MDRVRAELLGSMVVAERRREAARELVLAAVDRGRTGGRPLAGVIGRLLVRAGSRLEAIAAAGAVSRPVIVVDPCGGRAN